VTNTPRIAVLLCTYNGGRYLQSQLESIAAQDVGACQVYVSDDGSGDETLQVLSSAPAGLSDLAVRPGPARGSAANFLSLLTADDIEAEYFALADQDDIWDHDKLSRAVSALGDIDPLTPALYCSRTRSVAAGGRQIGLSPLFTRPPSFANALVHNIAGGNTMVMNRAGRDLLRRAGPVNVVSHDWWAYLLISGAGGRVVYDPHPGLSYRQHGDNQIGANRGWRRRVRRYLGALGGRNRDWNDRNIVALRAAEALLSPESRDILDTFERARRAGVCERVTGVRRAGLYAQTRSGNLGLFIASLLQKI